MTVARSDAWLFELRARCVAIARRRVEPDAVEDVVQEAMRVIVERGLQGPGGPDVEGRPPLAWCFQVLRNAIGNHYQKQRVRRARLAPLEAAEDRPDAGRTPLEALASGEAVRLLERALEAMSGGDPDCARRLRRLAEGDSPGALARAERVAEAAFYRRLYRCREKLRARLAELGVTA
jgi:RNA polymerase sigma factor (sigma-70 family)